MWKRELLEIEKLMLFLSVLIMALLGTVASYSYKVLSGQRFRWQVLLLQAFVSVFAGALVLMAALYYEWQPELAGGVSGLAGWSGAGFIKALERMLFDQIGGSNDCER